ncbi:hypothetical protein BCh11DRAFT_01758 [Burkholderia sp. Ch1-1]|nr:hypothetical protein BCh11DRAFT_01758 [Burkholderia sp. Ch1-1]
MNAVFPLFYFMLFVTGLAFNEFMNAARARPVPVMASFPRGVRAASRFPLRF